jgi:NAD+ diphosphatase
MVFLASVNQPELKDNPGYWFCFQNDNLMIEIKGDKAVVPLIHDASELRLNPLRTQYLGMLDGRDCFSAELPLTFAWPEGMAFHNLIEAFGKLDEVFYKTAVYAQQIVAWDRDHQYCSRCGSITHSQDRERAKKCPQCNLIVFPRISPAMMVCIIRENRILLARNRMFAGGFYSVLAGFVDPGERLEECVRREVKEEVGLQIENIRYFNSQPWPFPNSLMIAFIADYKAGEIKVDGNEIIEADWFSAKELPKCPSGKLSVAGKLIDWFRENY